MTALDAVLAARAHQDGRAARSSTYLHRHLVDDPIVVVPWHLGAEPFTYAAIAFGQDRASFHLVLPGEPRERRLLFPVTVELAHWFNAIFEEPWSRRVSTGDHWLPELAPTAPQVLVPNDGAATVLAKLGRRLAYLPTEARPDGPPPADPVLVRFGMHLMFLGSHFRIPGQQILVSAVSLAAEGWVTEQTVGERANLMALDAWIEPPLGVHGFDAAAAVEEISAGPLPAPLHERQVAAMIEEFNEARRAENELGMARALDEQRTLYTDLTVPVWDVLWRTVERERLWPEEPRFVGRRWENDCREYSRHMAWLDGPAGGRRRTRQSVTQAIRARRAAEEAKTVVEAETIVSDPVRLIPLLLDHKAVEGELISFDPINKEVKPGKVRASAVPVVTLRTERPCLIPVGKELWWTEMPDRVQVAISSVSNDPDGSGSIVVLKVMKSVKDAAALGSLTTPACFSQLTTKAHWSGPLPDAIPWTHRVPEPQSDGNLEDEA